MGDDAAQVNAEADQGLGDFWANPRDTHLGAEQAHRLRRMQQHIGDLCVNDGDTCDIDNHHPRPHLGDAGEQGSHHPLGAPGVDLADPAVKTFYQAAYPGDALQKLWWWPTQEAWFVKLRGEYADKFKAA